MEQYHSDEILYPGELMAFPGCGMFLCVVVSVVVITVLVVVVRFVLDKYWPKKDGDNDSSPV